VKKGLLVVVVVVMVVGFISGTVFAESKFTGFETSPAFCKENVFGFEVYVHEAGLAFCAGETMGFDTNIKVVPGNAGENTDEKSVVSDFAGMIMVNPHRIPFPPSP